MAIAKFFNSAHDLLSKIWIESYDITCPGFSLTLDFYLCIISLIRQHYSTTNSYFQKFYFLY